MLALVTLLIVYGSLYPWRFDFSRGHAGALWILLHAWPRVWNRFIWRDAGVNVAIYAPFGAAAFRSLARRMGAAWAMPAAVLLGAALSASMEMLQVYVPGRDCSLLDLATNTAGAAAGALAFAVWRADVERRPANGQWIPRRPYTGAILLLAFWAGFQWYPFFPSLGRTALGAAVSAVFHGHPIQPVEVFASAAEWFAAAVLLETCWPGIPWLWMALAMAGCMGRLLIHGRILAAGEVIGAALALWFWLMSRERRRPVLASGMLGVAILLREFAPFRFVHSPAPFWWIPLAASMTAERQAALIVLLRKLFDYGAVLWLFQRRGVPYRISGPALAAVLLLCEWAQRYIPGHTPESTDAVLAALMACLLAILERRDNRSWKYES